MEKRYNSSSFYLTIFCLGLSSYSLYSNMHNAWLISPPTLILLFLSITALVLALMGWEDKRNRLSSIRKWVTICLSSILAIVLSLVVLFSYFFSGLGSETHLVTTHSPDNRYTINFYQWDAGAAGTFGIRGERTGPLWFKKRIYYEKRADDVEVEWKSNQILTINGRELNLGKDESYGY